MLTISSGVPDLEAYVAAHLLRSCGLIFRLNMGPAFLTIFLAEVYEIEQSHMDSESFHQRKISHNKKRGKDCIPELFCGLLFTGCDFSEEGYDILIGDSIY